MIGPIEIARNQSITVLDQKILFSEQTIYAENLGDPIEPGAMVAISGFRTPEGAIIATRIDPVDFHAELHIRGAAVDIGADGFSINDLGVNYEGLTLADGDVVAVRGALIGAQFTAYDVRKDGAFEGLGLENISYQGIVDANSAGATLRVGEYSAANASIVTSPRETGDYALVVLEGRAQPDSLALDSDVRASAIEQQFLAPTPERLRRSTDQTDERNETPKEVKPPQSETRDRANEAAGDAVDKTINTNANARQIDEAPAATVNDPAPQQDRFNDDAREEPARVEEEEEAASEAADAPDGSLREEESAREPAPIEGDSETPAPTDETVREEESAGELESVDETGDATATERPAESPDEPERTDSDIEALPAERPEVPDNTDTERPDIGTPDLERPDRPERPEVERPERPERPQRPNR